MDTPITLAQFNMSATQELHDQLEPAAREAYLRYILNRTPAEWQDDMKTIIEEDFTPEPPDPTEATVTDGQSVPLQFQDGSAFPVNNGTIAVAGSAVTAVKIQPAASMAVVRSGDSVAVIDAADAAVAGSPGAATVSGSILTNVKLTA